MSHPISKRSLFPSPGRSHLSSITAPLSAKKIIYRRGKSDFFKQIIEKIEEPQKKRLFLMFIKTVQSNSDNPEQIDDKLKNKIIKIFGFDEEIINKIVSYSKHQSYYFRFFFTDSIRDLLLDLGYSFMDTKPFFFSNLDPLKDFNFDDFDLSYTAGNKLCFARNNTAEVDLRGMDLRGMDLRGMDLRGMDLRGMDLRGMDLTGADLRGVDFRGMDLTGTILRGANLRGADFRSVCLTKTDIRRANLRRANFSGTDLRGTDFSGSDLRKANFKGSDLSNVDLSDSDMRSLILTGINIDNTNLRGANIKGVKYYVPILVFVKNISEKQQIDEFFNKINSCSGIWSTISTISDDYIDFKLQLIEDIICQINVLIPQLKAHALTHNYSIIKMLDNIGNHVEKRKLISIFIDKYLQRSS